MGRHKLENKGVQLGWTKVILIKKKKNFSMNKELNHILHTFVYIMQM